MKAIEEAIFKVVKEILIKHEGHRQKAAAELGVTNRTITNYVKKWPQLREFVRNYGQWPDNKMTRRHPDEEEF